MKWISDSVSATPKTYNKHGLTPRPEFFQCGCEIDEKIISFYHETADCDIHLWEMLLTIKEIVIKCIVCSLRITVRLLENNFREKRFFNEKEINLCLWVKNNFYIHRACDRQSKGPGLDTQRSRSVPFFTEKIV